MYILRDRLLAQKINEEKANLVIRDVGKNLFDKKFLKELYVHKPMKRHKEIREIIEKLVHSSIMRLNTTSMTKLFELIIMDFKLCILRSRYPEEIYQITLNHLNSVLNYIDNTEENKTLINSIKDCISVFKSIYLKLTSYDYFVLKQTILRFLQGKNVKICHLINLNYQASNGMIYLPMEEQAPPLIEKPGEIKYYFAQNKVEGKNIILTMTTNYIANPNKNRKQDFDTKLGLNLFDNSITLNILGKKKVVSISDNKKEKLNGNNLVNTNTTNENTNVHQVNNSSKITNYSQSENSQKDEKRKKTLEKVSDNIYSSNILYNSNNVNEKNKDDDNFDYNRVNDIQDLANLINPYQGKENFFTIDLFPPGEDPMKDSLMEVEKESKAKSKYDDCFDITPQVNQENEEEDLLDLMDKAAENE